MAAGPMAAVVDVKTYAACVILLCLGYAAMTLYLALYLIPNLNP